jgi:hypothetical protein
MMAWMIAEEPQQQGTEGEPETTSAREPSSSVFTLTRGFLLDVRLAHTRKMYPEH